jgi:hypothetical protein
MVYGQGGDPCSNYTLYSRDPARGNTTSGCTKHDLNEMIGSMISARATAGQFEYYGATESCALPDSIEG